MSAEADRTQDLLFRLGAAIDALPNDSVGDKATLERLVLELSAVIEQPRRPVLGEIPRRIFSDFEAPEEVALLKEWIDTTIKNHKLLEQLLDGSVGADLCGARAVADIVFLEVGPEDEFEGEEECRWRGYDRDVLSRRALSECNCPQCAKWLAGRPEAPR